MTTNKPLISLPAYSKMASTVYDALCGFKDYKRESTRLKENIDRLKQSGGNHLLDVACGTGSHLVYLEDSFRITGLDKSDQQLVAARNKLPTIEFLKGDMRDFQLGCSYDVITCLFRSIGYMARLADLRQAIKNMADHLRPGGLLLLEPFFFKEAYPAPNGAVHSVFVDKPKLKISLIHPSKLEADKVIWEMHCVVGRAGHKIEYFVEHHEFGLYSATEYRQAIEDAGLKATTNLEKLSDSFDLLGAVKPT